MGKGLMKDKLYQMKDQFNENYIYQVLFNTSKQKYPCYGGNGVTFKIIMDIYAKVMKLIEEIENIKNNYI